ncbi:MAG: hypothetical protein HY744_09250 [Deltaproteobacteria bacterium]|nr:hypothetical protein [Deltaproteobacteria bacterium]
MVAGSSARLPCAAPGSPRRCDLRRWFRIACRTAHLATMGVLVGGHVFAVAPDSLRPWLYATIASGAALMAPDLLEDWRYLRELRGASLLVKMAMVAAVAVFWEQRLLLLFAVVVLSSVVSHMPGRYRYWVLGQGPPEEPE